jgi:hypothetical protein
LIVEGEVSDISGMGLGESEKEALFAKIFGGGVNDGAWRARAANKENINYLCTD